MNTLDCCRYKLNFDKHLHCKSIPLNLSVNHSFNSTVGLSLIFVFATFSRLGLGLQCFASLRGVTVGGHLYLNYCLNFSPEGMVRFTKRVKETLYNPYSIEISMHLIIKNHPGH